MRALSAAARRRRGNAYGLLAGRAGELIRCGRSTRGCRLRRCRGGCRRDLHYAVAARTSRLLAHTRRRNTQRAVARSAVKPNLSARAWRGGAGGRRCRRRRRRGSRLCVRNGTDRDLHLGSALRTLPFSPRSGIRRAHQFAATGTIEFDWHATLRNSDKLPPRMNRRPKCP